ncbi:flagellar hook-length control protein FliK [Stutzerimonas zhaodongensis]|uniref:Flagellar hook-length control protein FliK n=1 Tax=Stutzerimonas zhaodongensis TaxID=1176257 RepID=A0A3M2HPX8_9GAMM|nr:flagellar hook-length control protein FliK [Stutzerimonas zhaodongensis]MCQ4317877.1 flagellar hook-length control protein FliK [Stutzerimonas zhaodongensis]RMH88317.1 flagellar hook-length control protein FliK [Stutzerimonas zhaodongensis]
MNIQPISVTRAAAASAVLPAAPQAASAHQPAAGQRLAGEARRGFGERMQSASSETEGRLSELPAATLQGALPSPLAEQGQVLQAGGDATQGSEAPQELTPEQWLLGMLDQQSTDIQARDAGLADAAPLPVPQALPEVARTPLDPLAWLQGRDPFGDQQADAGAVDPLDARLTGDFQRRAAEMNPLMPAAMKPVVDMSLGQPAVAPAPVDTMPAASLDLHEIVESLDAGEPLTSTVERGQTAPVQADRALKLQAPEAKWGEQMLHALRENVDLQIQQKIQSATIRLDPPELGSMEIMLSHESGRLNVHLSAANADVARLLQQTSDRLRHELVGQHFVQVNVQVGADSGGQQGQQRQRAALGGDELPTAARQEEQQQSRERGHARDVLITV